MILLMYNTSYYLCAVNITVKAACDHTTVSWADIFPVWAQVQQEINVTNIGVPYHHCEYE